MKLEPFEWSVVVIGRWNRAILTPAGIGQRLFQVKEGTPLEVQIAIDQLGPPLVKYDGLMVVAGSDRLIVQPELPNRASLKKACNIARNAITSLPETPLSAIGININYACTDYFEQIDNVFQNQIDLKANQLELIRIENQLQNSYQFQSGRVKVIITHGEDEKRLLAFNFELQNDQKEAHLAWLDTSFELLLSLITKVSEDLLEIPKSEIQYEFT